MDRTFLGDGPGCHVLRLDQLKSNAPGPSGEKGMNRREFLLIKGKLGGKPQKVAQWTRARFPEASGDKLIAWWILNFPGSTMAVSE